MCPNTPEEREQMAKIPYAFAIGSIMYVMLCTRLDIAHAVSITSRYQSNPGEEHWIVVKNILKYLRRTKDLFLMYEEGQFKVQAYTNSDFQSDPNDYKSTFGFVLTLNGGAVSWKSSTQSIIADSTNEVEYVATWMKKFISKLGVIASIEQPITLFGDNSGAIAQVKEPRSHQKSKHIEW